MSLDQHAGHRCFFPQVSGILFGTVCSPEVFKTPARAAKAACGTV
jgi:hypothetical protein